MPAVAAVMGTYCGLTITPDAEVLNQKNRLFLVFMLPEK